MPEPSMPDPADVPARHDRLAAAMLTQIVDHGLREAVKWVMEPELLAMEVLIERRVRERVADEIKDPAVWPDHFACWTAEQAEAARTMKQYILARIARGKS